MKRNGADHLGMFPRKHRKEASKSASSATVSTIWPLTKNDIQRIVSCAFDDVFELLSTLGVDSTLIENNIHTLKNLNSFILNKMNTMTNTIDKSTPEDIESDSESGDIFDYHDSIDEEGNGTDNDYDSTIYELNDVTGDIFPGIRIFNSIERTKSSYYFKLRIDGKEKFIHKQTACWLFTDDKKSLSADRLRRVIGQNKNS